MQHQVSLNLQLHPIYSWFLFCLASQAPRITNVTPEVQVVDKGSDVILECEADGRPLPTVTWLKNNKILRNGTRFASYTLRAVSLDDSGQSVCVATNIAGVDKSFVIIQVKG